MKYNEILEWLRKYEFIVQHSELFYPNYIFCKKDQTNIVIKEYDNISPSEIRSDSVDIRSMLNALGENVWNTYFLICSNCNQKLIPYSIEKDAVGVRKYVINSLDDIKRIPFLDIITLSGKDSDNTNIKIHTNLNENLNKVIDHIISIDGLQRNLNEEEVLEVLSKFFGAEVDGNEN